MSLGNRDGRFGLIDLANQIVGKGIAAKGARRAVFETEAVRRSGNKAELAAGKLIAHLIVGVAADFAPELDVVLTANPAQVVDELHRGIVVLVRTLRAVTEARKGIDRNARNAPLHRWPTGKAGNPERADDVGLEGQLRTGRVIETGAAETELVHQGVGQHAGIRKHPLRRLGDDRFAIEEEILVDLIFLAAAVASEPVRLRRLHEVKALDELILIHGTAQRLGAVIAQARQIGCRVESQQPCGDRVESRRGNRIVRERRCRGKRRTTLGGLGPG